MGVSVSNTSGTGVSPVCATLLTSFTPGAIAIIHLHGEANSIDEALNNLIDLGVQTIGSMRLATFRDSQGEIDTGLVARITPTEVHLMPHGGPRVVQRLLARCADLGIEIVRTDTLPPQSLYPEANDDIEAMMLATLARARSPLAIELLLDQPGRWRDSPTLNDDDRARSLRLNRLITPPLVVLAGPANVGKSTLSNALLGRSMSIAVDQPGTTRDYITGQVELAGLVVLWHDTPGLRMTDDPIEREAIALASELMSRADFLIAMTDHEHDWPALPREADIRIANKCDVARRDDTQINISATTGEGIAELVRTIRGALVSPADLAHPGPWLFDERLAPV